MNDSDEGQTVRQTGDATASPAQAVRTSTSHSATPAAPAYLTDEQAAAIFGVSIRTFAKFSKEPWFPAPVVLGPRLKRHVRAELEAAAANMPRRTAVVEPSQLVRARRAKIESLKSRGVPA